MTSLSGLKYAPMMIDASDYTTLLKREGLLRQAAKQNSNVLDYKYYLSPSEVVSAAVGVQACQYYNGQYCKLPAILPTIVSGFTAESINLPS
jgi:hypothetical protein